MGCPVRKYPLTQPKDWEPPVPRWQLKLPANVKCIFTTYIGVQQHDSHELANAARAHAVEEIELWLDEKSHGPEVVDTFIVTEGFDVPSSRVWAAYWTSESTWQFDMDNLNLRKIWQALPDGSRSSIGLWLETFETPVERLETNYAGLHHKPGLASLPNTERHEHKLTAYWGAARDRIPASAQDLFPPASDSAIQPPKELSPRGLGQHLTGTNYDNMVHIRSGQIWTACPPEEAAAYTSTLEPVLMDGMRYLWTNAAATGTLGLRFLHNLDADGRQIDETCGAGFFRNLADLEQWSKRHPSHLKIFNGAHRHAREWGGARKFMTWHEVSVLKRGEARWEYLNCGSETGVLRGVGMEGVEELGEMKENGAGLAS